ncbi:MAG TPA: type VI secretion system baseplate subunit TssG [Roseomonas sp.]|jgi:type VI secretion system protein ImpH
MSAEPKEGEGGGTPSLLDKTLDATMNTPRFRAFEGPERPAAAPVAAVHLDGVVEAGDPPPSPSLRTLPPAVLLRREPTRFHPDEAAAITAQVSKRPVRDLNYRTLPRLGHPAGAVTQARPDEGELTLATFGLIGSGGTLPRHHTATVAAELRKRSRALHGFLDLLAQRMAGQFVAAGAKYRPTRDPEPARRALAAAIGMGTKGLDGRMAVPPDALLYHAGNLSSRSRSAERLRGLLEAETERPVEIEEFAGGWMRLPPTEQSRLPAGRGAGQHGGLGSTAVLGAQVWDAQARFIIRIGPLTRPEFEALLPGEPAHKRVTDLTRLFVGLDTGFAINLVLKAEEVPQASLGGGARLGWSSWPATPKPRTAAARDAIFEPQDVT